MGKKIKSKYKRYKAEMIEEKETPLSYINWMEIKLQALMDFRSKIEPCSICAGYMLKRSKKGE